MSRPYSFRIEDNDKDLKKKLDSMAGKERSSYIREALRFYERFGQEISTISMGIKNILCKMETGNLSFRPETSEKGENVTGTDEIILSSIQDLLDL